jgi:hypothetical protein
MSPMKALSARTRWRSPSASRRHSSADRMRGTMSKGISRSLPSCSPYTAKVMPTRWNRLSASARLRRSVSSAWRVSQSA